MPNKNFIEELQAQIAFQAGRDKNCDLPAEYQAGYIDGLKQALAIYQD